jgi:predicted MFS family arabinose efflux permease
MSTLEARSPPLQDSLSRSKLLLIRLMFLTYYGSLGTIMPYLPVYYHHLGHGGQIIGLLGAVKPFTTFLVAPLWGLIADQTQKPFVILNITFLVSLVGQLLVGVRHEALYITFMVFLTAVFNAPVKSLIDSMVMEHIPEQSSYGRLRLWGQMGFGVASSCVGILLSKSKHVPWPDTNDFSLSTENTLARLPSFLQKLVQFTDKWWRSMTGYKLLFLTYAALSAPTWFCIQAFRQMDEKSKRVAKKSRKRDETTKVGEGLLLLLQNADALLFFSLVLVVGISSGVIENFAYVRMREVGGTGKQMGLSRLVSSLAGAPMFWFSGPLTETLGADRVIVLSLLSYVTRFLIYAFMRNPYHGLPAEALRGVTFAAFWSTATIYAHRVSPPGLHATMLMFLNAIYGGLGQSVGAIIGGKMQHRFGTVKTFLYSAGVDLVFVCGVVAYLNIRQDSSFKNPKPIVARKRGKQS